MDSEKLKENILDQFLRWGGTIEEIEGVEEVDAKWRKGLTISLGGDRRVLQSKCLILNSPLHHLSALPGKVGKLLSKWAKKIEPRYVLSPLFLGVREKVIPVGMKDLLVSILNLGKPYEGGNVLFLALSRKGDETEAPERKRALTVQSLIPWGNGPRRWDQPFLVEHQEAVMKHLRQLLPFLDDHVEFIDSNWANEQASWSSYPLFLFTASSGFHWREGVVPIRLSKNLFFAGKENFPYLGTEGEILSGWMAARQILQKHL